MILLKLGGSIITNKNRPLTPRRATISKITEVLDLDEPLVIVHGGGSFGHYWSVKYDMHTAAKEYDARGVSIVKNSMIQLDKIILDAMVHNGLKPYSLPPTDFMRGDRPIRTKILEIANIAQSMIPVTYGDALWYGKNMTYILSGDRIMSILAKIIRPRLCIFALNEDGLYRDMKTRELIREVDGHVPDIKSNVMDVTGGMTRKIESARTIAKKGIDVFFVNGAKPERLVQAIKRDKFEGTMFRGKI